jgi:hypothetical protein
VNCIRWDVSKQGFAFAETELVSLVVFVRKPPYDKTLLFQFISLRPPMRITCPQSTLHPRTLIHAHAPTPHPPHSPMSPRHDTLRLLHLRLPPHHPLRRLLHYACSPDAHPPPQHPAPVAPHAAELWIAKALASAALLRPHCLPAFCRLAPSPLAAAASVRLAPCAGSALRLFSACTPSRSLYLLLSSPTSTLSRRCADQVATGTHSSCSTK